MKNRKIVRSLVTWFAKHARPLPWRRTRDPYAIWVSEVMLQQTQVKTVLPYWERWMRALPNVETLAKARPGRLHKLWEGLGYYTRVRNLQRAARVIRKEHGGRFPRKFEAVLGLPGIGRYTAGAICSIAFNSPQPILDGNVIRVLARVYGIGGDPRGREVNARLWELADELVRCAARLKARRGCSALNQSLMELGALVCTPQQPRCGVCPVAKQCVSRQEGRVEELPGRKRRTRVTARRFLAFVAQRDGLFLVRQRPAGVVNAHLWEFPNVEVTPGDSDLKGAARKALGVRPARLERLGTIRHSITRYRITLETYRVIPARAWKRTVPLVAASRESAANFSPRRQRRSAEPPLRPRVGVRGAKDHSRGCLTPALSPGGRWLGRSALTQLAFTSAHKRILQHQETKKEA